MSCPCGAPTDGIVCRGCASDLRRPPEHWIGGLLIRSAFLHHGVARTIVHRLKYHGVVPETIGRVVSRLLPPGTTCLVPVPRVVARRWRYGVDPAREIAALTGRASGLPVTEALRAPFWVRHRAGSGDEPRGTPRFVATATAPSGAVLIDDVVTTGTTLLAAARACDVATAVTLTSAIRP